MKKMLGERKMLVLTDEEMTSTYGVYAPSEREEPEIGDPDYFRDIMKWY